MSSSRPFSRPHGAAGLEGSQARAAAACARICPTSPPSERRSTMRFGLLYEAQRPFEGKRVDWNALYKETLEQCVLADTVGFDNLWFVEHHFLTGFSGSP